MQQTLGWHLVHLCDITNYKCKLLYSKFITTFIQAWRGATVYSYFTAQEKEIVQRWMGATWEIVYTDGD